MVLILVGIILNKAVNLCLGIIHRDSSSFLCRVWGRFWSICSSVRSLNRVAVSTHDLTFQRRCKSSLTVKETGNMVYPIRSMHSFIQNHGIDSVRPSAIINMAHGRMGDRKSTRLNSSHSGESRMPSSA